MPLFTYITDLPPHVRGALDVDLQQLWLNTFSQVEQLTGNHAEAYNTAWLNVFKQAFPGQIANINDAVPQIAAPATDTGAPPASALIQSGLPFSEGVVGYWIDLAKYQFDDESDTPTTWLQAFPFGTYHHPVYGKIDMTPERAARMAQNVQLNVRGQDLDIDYDHKEKLGDAAGWVKGARVQQDGLYLAVQWTKEAYQKLKDRAYRYFSPEFADKWTHPATKVQHRDVLFGGALTNRPFLKGILPINLSEVIKANEGGNLVDRATMEKLAKLLGIQFDENTTDEDLGKALSDVEKLPEPEKKPDPKDDGEPDPEKKPVPALNETELKRLAETNDAVKALLAERDQNNVRIAALEAGSRLSEITIQLKDLSTKCEAKGYAIPPAVLDEIRDVAAQGSVKLGDSVITTFANFVDKGLVELGERGKNKPDSQTNTATKKFNDRVEKIIADEKLSYADAAVKASEDEELFNAYLAEQAEGVQL